MNISNPVQRVRGPASGPPSDSVSRPSQDSRDAGAGPVVMSRAERFEDEKRRIIDSCFGKKDADGSSRSPFKSCNRNVDRRMLAEI